MDLLDCRICQFMSRIYPSLANIVFFIGFVAMKSCHDFKEFYYLHTTLL